MRGAALAGALTERLRYSGPAPCPLCDADGERCTQDGPFHLFCECTHPTVQAGCKALQSTLPAARTPHHSHLHGTSIPNNACGHVSACLRFARHIRGLRSSSEQALAGWQGHHLPPRDGDALPGEVRNRTARLATATADGSLPGPSLRQHGRAGPLAAPPRQPLGQVGRAPDPTLRTCAGRMPSGPPSPPAQKMLLMAMLPICLMLASHSLAALTARAATAPQTTTLRSRRLSLSRIPTRRTLSDAHDWPRDARAPLSVDRCCVPAQPALPNRANGSPLVCRCGSAGSAVSQVPSSCWHACEGRPSLGAA